MKNYIILLFGFCSVLSFAQSDRILKELENNQAYYANIALQIWEYAEMGYQEEKSSTLLQKTLSDAGFTIKKGVAGIPTSFIAEYSNDGPVIAILGEYAALPGLSQKAVPYKVSNQTRAGHACGHHLFGTASAAAAISLKDFLIKSKTKGTIRFYGCPAEEGGLGKYI